MKLFRTRKRCEYLTAVLLLFEFSTISYYFYILPSETASILIDVPEPDAFRDNHIATYTQSDVGKEPKGQVVFCHVRKAAGTSIFNFLKSIPWFSNQLNLRWWKFEFDACPTKCFQHEDNTKLETAWIMNMRDPIERHISEFWYSGPGSQAFEQLNNMTLVERNRLVNELYDKWRVGDFSPGDPSPGMFQDSPCGKSNLKETHGRMIYKTGCYLSNYMIRMLLGDHAECGGFNQRTGFYDGEVNNELYYKALMRALRIDRVMFTSSIDEDFRCLAKDLIKWGLANENEIYDYWRVSDKTHNENRRHFKGWEPPEMLQKIRKDNEWDIRLVEELKQRKKPC